MQLIRYLMTESFNFCKLMKIKKSKPDEMLNNTIFKFLDSSKYFFLKKDVDFCIMLPIYTSKLLLIIVSNKMKNSISINLKSLKIYWEIIKLNTSDTMSFHKFMANIKLSLLKVSRTVKINLKKNFKKLLNISFNLPNNNKKNLTEKIFIF